MKRAKIFIAILFLAAALTQPAHTLAQAENRFTVLTINTGYSASQGAWVQVLFEQTGGSWRVAVRKWWSEEEFKAFLCLAPKDEVTLFRDTNSVWHLKNARKC